jgi:hypothetical protein
LAIGADPGIAVNGHDPFPTFEPNICRIKQTSNQCK